jgi:hypothetical protein
LLTPDPHGGSPLLGVLTTAVSVTLPPDAMLVGLGVTTMDVDACVTVTDSEFDELAL